MDYTTTNGSATAGTDYTGQTDTLTFAPGETEQTITVATSADDLVELNEDFTITLSNIQAGLASVSFADAQGLGTILDARQTGPVNRSPLTPDSAGA